MADHAQQVNINLDPQKTPVYFVDGCVISSTEQSVTLNFVQAIIDGSQQNVIARVAMTPAQSKNFLKDFNDHLEKFER